MQSERFIENLFAVLPYWHYKIVKPFGALLKAQMGMEAYYCLQTLRQCGSMTMTELAGRLKITKQQATKTVEKLYEKNFVSRIYGERDRRFIHIKITEEGRRYLEGIFRQDENLVERLEEKIGKEDVKALGEAMETLLRVLPKVD